MDLFLAVSSFKQLYEVLEKLVAELIDELFGVLADDEHLPDMALRLCMHFESIGITALLFADLAIPSESLKTFGLEFVVQVLGRTDLGLWHVGRASMVAILTL